MNEGANGGSGTLVALEPNLPDLQVSSLTFSHLQDQHALSSTEYVNATVTNIGAISASNAVVALRDNGVVLQSQTVVTLASGASTPVSFQWTPTNGGTRTIGILADPGKLIAEWDETNNEQTQTFPVGAPDFLLSLNDPQLSPSQLFPPGTVSVSVTVWNNGTVGASNVPVWFLDQGSVFSQPTVNLPAGGSAALTRTLFVDATYAFHDITVEVDPNNQFSGMNEANNNGTSRLKLLSPAPDLHLTDANVTLSDPNPDEGQVLGVTVAVRNDGQGNAPGSTANSVVVQLLVDGQSVDSQTIPSISGVRPVSLDSP